MMVQDFPSVVLTIVLHFGQQVCTISSVYCSLANRPGTVLNAVLWRLDHKAGRLIANASGLAPNRDRC